MNKSFFKDDIDLNFFNGFEYTYANSVLMQ